MAKSILLAVLLAISSGAMAGSPLKGADVKLGKSDKTGAVPADSPSLAAGEDGLLKPKPNKGTVRGGISINAGRMADTAPAPAAPAPAAAVPASSATNGQEAGRMHKPISITHESNVTAQPQAPVPPASPAALKSRRRNGAIIAQDF